MSRAGHLRLEISVDTYCTETIIQIGLDPHTKIETHSDKQPMNLPL